MIILNFSHPISDSQITQILNMTKVKDVKVIDIPVHFNNHIPYNLQIKDLVYKIPLSSESFQNLEILINPPAYSYITAALLAFFHGRIGYFPAILRFRVMKDSLPPVYELAEIINLYKMREEARKDRFIRV